MTVFLIKLFSGYNDGMKYISGFILYFLFLGPLSAQDERLFRSALKGELIDHVLKQETKVPKIVALSSAYRIDFNQDGRQERMILMNIDGKDHVGIQGYDGKWLKKFPLETKGPFSKVMKVRVVSLSKSSLLYAISLYEGKNKYLEVNANARYYFLTIDHKKLKTLSMYQGPAFWMERSDGDGNYSQRKYSLNIDDINLDGVKDVILKYPGISYSFLYKGDGKWGAL